MFVGFHLTVASPSTNWASAGCPGVYTYLHPKKPAGAR